MLIGVAYNSHHTVVQQLIEADADLVDTALIRATYNGQHATIQPPPPTIETVPAA